MNRLSLLSQSVARWEIRAAALMLAVIVSTLVFNIITRTSGQAQYWVDEIAVTALTWMTFLAASAVLQARSNISMTLLQDAVPASLRKLMDLLVDLVMLAFTVAFLVMVWRWFDLPGLAKAQFDMVRFTSETFNFIYEEPTQTLGIRKFWIWLILPIFSVTSLLHCLACLCQNIKQFQSTHRIPISIHTKVKE